MAVQTVPRNLIYNLRHTFSGGLRTFQAEPSGASTRYRLSFFSHLLRPIRPASPKVKTNVHTA